MARLPSITSCLLLLHSVLQLVTTTELRSAVPDSLYVPADTWGNVVPDFSFAGFEGGGVLLPEVPVVEVLVPCLDGVDICAGRDDTDRIQNALNRIAKGQQPQLPMGERELRGALLLRAGTYRVARTLFLNSTGVILRGEGSLGTAGKVTTLIATGTSRRPLIQVGASDPADRRYASLTTSLRNVPSFPIVDDLIPVGATRFTISSGGSTSCPMQAGDRILITRPRSASWIQAIGMSNIPPRMDDATSGSWSANTYTWSMPRAVVRVTRGSTVGTCELEVDVPFYMSLDRRFGGGAVQSDKGPTLRQAVYNVAVENLLLQSEYAAGQEEQDENHATYGILLDRVVNAWVADVTIQYFQHGILVDYMSRYVTIQDSRVLDPVSVITGGRRYSFNVNGMFVLVQRCHADKGRHDYVTSARVQGPNVFLDSTSTNAYGDTGPHERFAFGILYDRIRSRSINCMNRGNLGTGQGWSGAFHVFWNCEAGAGGGVFQAPAFTSNWVVGFQGVKARALFYDPEDQADPWNATFVSPGNPVQPAESLYLWQLAQRKGLQAAMDVLQKRSYPEFSGFGGVEPTDRTQLRNQDNLWFIHLGTSDAPSKHHHLGSPFWYLLLPLLHILMV